MPTKDDHKTLKKLAKAETKANKKSSPPAAPASPTGTGFVEKTPAERSADAAEKQLVMHRWKVVFAGIGALVALVTLIVLLLQS